VQLAKLDGPDATAEFNEANYTTSEGDVLLVQKGRSVFIAEGFDRTLAHKIFDNMTLLQSDRQPKLPRQVAAPSEIQDELSGQLADWMGTWAHEIALRGIH